MLFVSHTFLLVFLPLTLLGYHLLRLRLGKRTAIAFLAIASLVFYAYDSLPHLLLMIISIVINLMVGRMILASRERAPAAARGWLIVGIVFNLVLLFYFKYTTFALGSLVDLTGLDITVPMIVLPIGISFYTFTQIAYLVDCQVGKSASADPIDYALFVTFFPHLVAGPIIHHGEMMPQFQDDRRTRILDDLAIGLAIFTVGFAKKILLADPFAVGSTAMFDAVRAGGTPGLFEAWSGALCYTLQIYFDFSGYSDMAIGLARMFGIRLPVNFASPYAAVSIIDFWRRWHITLSRFLRDYLYVPLGGGRHGTTRRYINIGLTMLLGGIWHGAGWTFVIWGALHALYIVINHLWQDYSPFYQRRAAPWRRWVGWFVTILCVIIAWVPFRADGLATTLTVYAGMLGLNGITLPGNLMAQLGLGEIARQLEGLGLVLAGPGMSSKSFVFYLAAPVLVLGLLSFMPDTHRFFARYRPAMPSAGYPESEARPPRWPFIPVWRMGLRSAVVLGIIFALTFASLNRPSEFIYFQF